MPSTIFLTHHESGKPVTAGHPRALIYFICGNPGLINFYDDYLGILAQQIRASPVTRAYDIYGRDLYGFDDDDHAPFAKENPPLDLEAQIKGAYQDVVQKAAGEDYEFVVLMGHSVGAYIATEIMHRHMKDGNRTAGEIDLRHGILLFPTLTHIAKSPSGKHMSLLQHIPLLNTNFHLVAKGLLSLFSQSTICWVVENVMGFSTQAAGVVSRWLKSRDGVWQAVHLGQSEMATIREDVWEAELWDIVHGEDGKGDGKRGPPKFFMFYAKHDHWVANKLRDEFIDSRQESGARMVIDEGDIPHAFCTRESKCILTVSDESRANQLERAG